MVNSEKLVNAGIDMDSLLKRLMGNESLIRIFVKKFTEDQTYTDLLAAFVEKDMKKAEHASHTLKGMCGNMSLTVLYGLFTDQTNLIRGGEYKKAEDLMYEITAAYNETIANMRAWLAQS